MKKTIFVCFFCLSFYLLFAQQQVVYYWSFNNPTGTAPTAYASPLAGDIGGATITHNVVETNSFSGTSLGAETGYAAEEAFCPIGNQSNGNAMVINLPTTGFTAPFVKWWQRGTSTGFNSRVIDYSTDGTHFQNFTTSSGVLSSTFTEYSLDFSGVANVNNNPNFKVRITFNGATNSSGNNRIDNLKMLATPAGIVPDPEPSNHVLNFSFTGLTHNSVVLQWSENQGVNPASSYLIVGMNDDGDFYHVADATPVSDDLDFSDGNFAKNVTGTTLSVVGLTAATNYAFCIYPYSNTGSAINYKTSVPVPYTEFTTLEQPTVILDESFESQTLGVFSQYSAASNLDWVAYSYSGRWMAKASGFNGDVASDDWLISPPLNLNIYANEILTFESAVNYTDTVTGLEVKLSTDYNGSGNPHAFTWTTLNAQLSQGSFVWANSGAIDLSSYSGSSVYLAFHYTCSSPTSARTWEVDNIMLTGYLTGTPDTANHLAFMQLPTTGIAGYPLGVIEVQALRADNSLDTSFNGNVTIAVQSGPGSIAGQLTAPLTGGRAYFTSCVLDQVGAYTLTTANTLGLSNAVSGDLQIMANPNPGAYAYAGFEAADTWFYTNNPAAYTAEGNTDLWGPATANGTILPYTGVNCWAMRDLNNPNGGGDFFHELIFPAFALGTGSYSLSFRYAYDFANAAATDQIKYNIQYNNLADWPEADEAYIVNGGGAIATNGWNTVSVNIPAGSAFVRIKFFAKFDGGSDYAAFDELMINSLANNPLITVSGAFNAFATQAGTPSAVQFVTVNGTNLTSAITVASVNGYELSLAEAGPFVTSSLIIPQTGGIVNAVNLYIRLQAETVGQYNGSFVLTSQGAQNVNVGVTGTVSAGGLALGDLAVIAYSVINNDRFALVALRDIPGGSIVHITDNGILENGTLRTGENTLQWIAPETTVPAGTILQFSNEGGANAELIGPGSCSGVLSGLSTSGDQLIIYQGTAAAPNFIWALTTNSWVTATGQTLNSNTSYLPAVLTGYSLDFSAHAHCGYYRVTPSDGPKELQVAAIADSSNWSRAAVAQTWADWQFNFTAPHESYAKVKVFVQGAYTEGALRLSLNSVLPLTSPYVDALSVNAIPTDMTDWVYVELREQPATTPIAAKSALLLNTGKVVDADYAINNQIDYLRFPELTAGNYYVVIRHRNSLAVMSTTPLAFTSNAATCATADLTTGVYGNGAAEVATGVWAMRGGDLDQNGYITTADYTVWFNHFTIGVSGYYHSDLNFDENPTTEDYTLWYNNFLSGAFSAVPEILGR